MSSFKKIDLSLDAWEALHWTFSRGADVLGIDAARICVGGPSA